MKRDRVQRLESRANADGEFLVVELREFESGYQVLSVEHRWRDLDKPTAQSKRIGVVTRVELST